MLIFTLVFKSYSNYYFYIDYRKVAHAFYGL